MNEVTRPQLKDPDATRSLSSICKSLNDAIRHVKVLESHPLFGAQLIEGVALSAAGFTEVKHSLGRNPTGFIVANANASANVYRDSILNELHPEDFIRLKASATVTVSLLVF